jgi:hypothetical protein
MFWFGCLLSLAQMKCDSLSPRLEKSFYLTHDNLKAARPVAFPESWVNYSREPASATCYPVDFAIWWITSNKQATVK